MATVVTFYVPSNEMNNTEIKFNYYPNIKVHDGIRARTRKSNYQSVS